MIRIGRFLHLRRYSLTVGPLYLRLSRRDRERRLKSWCGIGPAVDNTAARGRHVVGAAVHAGPLLLVLIWR